MKFGDKKWPGLAKLNEECGEVVQVCGKLIQTGGKKKHWSGADLKHDLREELADTLASIGFVLGTSFSEEDLEYVMDRAEQKIDLFIKWHLEQGGEIEDVGHFARASGAK